MSSPAGANKNNATILWWIGWIVLTIGSFFVACYFWTWFIAEHMGSIKNEGVTVMWVTAVFGTWMVFLLPLIIVMYNKVDKAYEDSRIKREAMELKRKEAPGGAAGDRVRMQFVEESRRLLRDELRKKVKKFSETIKGGNLVTAVLRDGRRFENVFVAHQKEVLGIYGVGKLPFDIQEIADFEPADLDHLPMFSPGQWLRLDGGDA